VDELTKIWSNAEAVDGIRFDVEEVNSNLCAFMAFSCQNILCGS
jgi:hypothetical protein